MKANPQKLTMYTGIGLIVIILAIIAYANLSQGQGTQLAGELDYTGQPSLGESSAPVKVALFEDFRCGGCATFSETVFPRLQRDYVDSGDVEVFFYNFPVLGAPSVAAAQVAECVYQENAEAFWDYKKFAFRTHLQQGQGAMTPAQLSEVATLALPDVDSGAINQCATEGWYAEAVESDIAIANEFGFNSTPTVVVDGVRVATSSYDAVRAAIDSALAEAN